MILVETWNSQESTEGIQSLNPNMYAEHINWKWSKQKQRVSYKWRGVGWGGPDTLELSRSENKTRYNVINYICLPLNVGRYIIEKYVNVNISMYVRMSLILCRAN